MPKKKAQQHQQFSWLSARRPPPAERAHGRYQLPRRLFAGVVTAGIGLHLSLFFSVRLCQTTADSGFEDGW